MEEIIKFVMELHHLLPASLQWLTFLVIPLMVVGLFAYRYVFSAGQPNLLTFGERRRRERIKFIEECLESKHNDDENVIASLKEERQSLIFQEMTKLKVKRPMRQQLVLLHDQSSSRDTWGEIRTGFHSLKEKDGKLVKGVDRIDAVFGALAGVFGTVMVITSFCLFIYVADAAGGVSPQTIKLGFLTAFLYLGAGMVSLRFALPALRAKQLQKHIPVEAPEKEPVELKAGEVSHSASMTQPSSERSALPPGTTGQTTAESLHVASHGHENGNAKVKVGTKNGEENGARRD
jgi:hypothetical protein